MLCHQQLLKKYLQKGVPNKNVLFWDICLVLAVC